MNRVPPARASGPDGSVWDVMPATRGRWAIGQPRSGANMNAQPKQFVVVATGDRYGDVVLLRDGAWMSEASIRQKDEFSFLYVPRMFPSKAAARQFINRSLTGMTRVRGRYKTMEWQASQLGAQQ
jgi:hypothetical protein